MTSLRIAVLTTGRKVSRWQADALAQALALPGVRLDCVLRLRSATEPARPRLSRGQRLRRSLQRGDTASLARAWIARRVRGADARAWRSYERWDRRRTAPSCDAEVDADALFGDAPWLTLETERAGRFRQRVLAQSCEAVRERGLDVILRFSSGILTGEILDAARLGVWSYHHGDPQGYRGLPPCFWEMRNGEPSSGAMLQRLNEKLDAGVILRRGSFSIDTASYARHRNRVFLGSAPWFAQCIARVLLGDESFCDTARAGPVARTILRRPGTLDTLVFAMRSVWTALDSRMRPREREGRADWAVAATDAPALDLINGALAPERLSWLEGAEGRFAADPFPFECGGRRAVLFEDAEVRSGFGRISAAWVDPRGRAGAEPFPVLERPFHLSFPSVVSAQGGTYLLPEQHETGRVSLYRLQSNAVAEPEERVLLDDFPGVDPVLHESECGWFLFVGRQDERPQDRLYVFHAQAAEGPFRPHPASPIEKPGEARNAGSLLHIGGRLFRPSQTYRGSYGTGVVLNEICRLTPTEFEERRWIELTAEGDWYRKDGLHHLSVGSDLLLFDAKRHPERRASLRVGVVRLVRRLAGF